MRRVLPLASLLFCGLTTAHCRSPNLRFHEAGAETSLEDGSLDTSELSVDSEVFDALAETALTSEIAADNANESEFVEPTMEASIEAGTDASRDVVFDAEDSATEAATEAGSRDASEVGGSDASTDTRSFFQPCVGLDALPLMGGSGTPPDAGYRCPSDFVSLPPLPAATEDPSRLRPLAPLSGQVVASRQPRVRWYGNPALTLSARLEWSRDRYFTRIEFTQNVSGTAASAVPPSALEPGVWYWRLIETSPLPSAPTAVWQLVVPLRAPSSQQSNELLFDPNGDGLAELAFGFHGYQGERGGFRVYPGACRVPPGLGRAQEFCAVDYDQLGYAVTNAGDLDGDGYSDLAVSAPGIPRPIGGGVSGHVHVFWGGPEGIDVSRRTTLYPSRSTTAFGGLLAGVGDLDGDGYSELASSSYRRDGVVTPYLEVFYGAPDRELSRRQQVLPTYSNGVFIAPVGDLTGDGLAELVYSSGQDQRVVAMSWNASAGQLVTTHTIAPPGPSGRFGTRFAGADVDGNGTVELLISAPGANAEQGLLHSYSLDGGMLSPPRNLLPADTLAGQRLGEELVSFGDLNNDGFQDLAVSRTGIPSLATVLILLGSATGLNETGYLRFFRPGIPSDGSFGVGLRHTGDIDGDGYGEFAVGVFDGTLGANPRAGALTLHRGGPTGPTSLQMLFLGQAGTLLGQSVASLHLPSGAPRSVSPRSL